MKEKINTIKIICITFFRTMKLLWRASRKMFVIIFISNFTVGITTPISLWIWKEFIDSLTQVLKSGTIEINKIFFWILMHLVVTMFKSIIDNTSEYYKETYSEYIDKSITKNVMSKVLKLSLEDFDNHETYNDIQKSNQQSLARSMSILQTTISIIKNVTSLVGTMALLVEINNFIIILCIFSSAPLFYISCRVLNKWFNIFNERYETTRFLDYLKTIIIKNENIKEIKVYNSGNYILGIILNIQDKYITQNKKIRRRFLAENALIDLIDNILTYSIKILLIYISVKSKLSIGSITMYISSVDSLKGSVGSLLSSLSSAYEDCLYMQSLFTLLDMTTEDQENKFKLESNIDSIELKNVSFKYPGTDKYVIKDINLKFNSNKTYAIVGLNGSGKTTLIKIILGFYKPTKGEVLLNGINIENYNKSSLYNHISAIFQDFIKYPFDIKTNIGIGNFKEIENMNLIRNAAKNAGADLFIKDLPQEYNTKLQKEWSESVDLSLGQWQKIAISRSLMKPASLLILDEPTSSLDVLSEYDIFNRLKEIKKNKLCIFVTHRLTNICLADQIIVMESGKVIEQGSHVDLIDSSGVYSELYEIQAEYYNKAEKQSV